MKPRWKKTPSRREDHWMDKIGETLVDMSDRLMVLTKGAMTASQMREVLLNSTRLALSDADDLTLFRAEREQTKLGPVSIQGDPALAGVMRRTLKDEINDWRRALRPTDVLRFVNTSFDLMFRDDEAAREFALQRLRKATWLITVDYFERADGDDLSRLLGQVLLDMEKALGDAPDSDFFGCMDIRNDRGVVEQTELIEGAYRLRVAFGQTDYRDGEYSRTLMD